MFEENLKNEYKKKCIIEGHDDLLNELSRMRALISGQLDILFCNYFLNESVELLINSIFLMEDGYFDCAFYSVRQSAENMNNMLLLSADKEALSKWNKKGYFQQNKKIEKELTNINSTYDEIKSELEDFFNEFDTLISTINKTIHKQGFDTFYKIREENSNYSNLDKNNELQLFDKLLKYSICRLYIFFIILDPMGLILADNDLDKKLNFQPITEAINLTFIKNNCHLDLFEKIKNTNFYKNLVTEFSNNEEMNDFTYAVVREEYYNLNNLNEINEQKHLLNTYEQFFLGLLSEGLIISEFHIGRVSFFPYSTSCVLKYERYSYKSNEFDRYEQKENSFNSTYHNVYITSLNIFDNKIFLLHNEMLDDNEIAITLKLLNNYNKQYKLIMQNLE